MLKVFMGKRVPGLPEVLAYSPSQVVVEVQSPSEADYLLIPHNWRYIRDNKTFLQPFAAQGKRVIIFSIGDSDEPVDFPNAIVFRTSQYKSALRPGEIIMPTVVEDLGKRYGVTTLAKQDKPSVGFVGWAEQEGFAKVKTTIKNLLKFGPRKKGLYFRQRAIDMLARSPLVRTNFLTTRTYGYETSDERERFVKNIKDTDFTLAPKGDGNYSARFYETLSLGRLPVLIDTDVVLPLEDEIDYSKFVVRVRYDQLVSLPAVVSKFYNSLSAVDYANAQQAARSAFVSYLEIESYFKHVLSQDFLAKVI